MHRRWLTTWLRSGSDERKRHWCWLLGGRGTHTSYARNGKGISEDVKEEQWGLLHILITQIKKQTLLCVTCPNPISIEQPNWNSNPGDRTREEMGTGKVRPGDQRQQTAKKLWSSLHKGRSTGGVEMVRNGGEMTWSSQRLEARNAVYELPSSIPSTLNSARHMEALLKYLFWGRQCIEWSHDILN